MCGRGVPAERPQETTLCEAVKVKPRLPWRPQDVRDARAMGYLLRKAASREWNQSKREKCVAVSKAEMSWRSEEHFDIRHEDSVFGVGPAGVWSCVGPVFPYNVPFFYVLEWSHIFCAIVCWKYVIWFWV